MQKNQAGIHCSLQKKIFKKNCQQSYKIFSAKVFNKKFNSSEKFQIFVVNFQKIFVEVNVLNFFEPKDKFDVDFLVDLHNDDEQIKRQGRISQFTIKQKDGKPMIDYDLKTMRTTKGKDYDEFDVTLEKCSCKDFIFRRKPCKHMYRLAKELGLYSRVDDRSKVLIADFSKGYADNWKFIVRPNNYLNLDIVESNLLVEGEKSGKDSKKEIILTQGKLYNFTRGEIFYDSLVPYTENLTWREAVKKLNYNLNILQIDYAEETVAIQEIIFKDNKFINQYTPIYGDIEFTHYKIIENSSEWETVEKYSSRQDEFVELLKTGEFADLDGEIQKIC